MNCSICASLSARGGLLAGMKILLSLGKRPWPARSRGGRAVSVGDFLPPKRATRAQRARKKTEAVLEVRIIMARKIYHVHGSVQPGGDGAVRAVPAERRAIEVN